MMLYITSLAGCQMKSVTPGRILSGYKSFSKTERLIGWYKLIQAVKLIKNRKRKCFKNYNCL